jgi:hypothetical protein
MTNNELKSKVVTLGNKPAPAWETATAPCLPCKPPQKSFDSPFNRVGSIFSQEGESPSNLRITRIFHNALLQIIATYQR